jgi:hypothetical protein
MAYMSQEGYDKIVAELKQLSVPRHRPLSLRPVIKVI